MRKTQLATILGIGASALLLNAACTLPGFGGGETPPPSDEAKTQATGTAVANATGTAKANTTVTPTATATPAPAAPPPAVPTVATVIALPPTTVAGNPVATLGRAANPAAPGCGPNRPWLCGSASPQPGASPRAGASPAPGAKTVANPTNNGACTPTIVGAVASLQPGHDPVEVSGPATVSVWNVALAGTEYVYYLPPGEKYTFTTATAGQGWAYPLDCADTAKGNTVAHGMRLAQRGDGVIVKLEKPPAW